VLPNEAARAAAAAAAASEYAAGGDATCGACGKTGLAASVAAAAV